MECEAASKQVTRLRALTEAVMTRMDMATAAAARARAEGETVTTALLVQKAALRAQTRAQAEQDQARQDPVGHSLPAGSADHEGFGEV